MTNGNQSGPALAISAIFNVVLLLVTYGQYREAQRANHEAALARAQATDQSEKNNRLQREMFEAEERRASQEAKLRRAPHLIVQRCCNQVPVAIVAGTTGQRRVLLRRLVSSISTDDGTDDDFPDRCDHTFIAQLRNVGSGVAFNSKAFWEIEYVILSDGRREKVPDSLVSVHLRPYLSPAVIGSNEICEMRQLPHFVEFDDQLKVSQVVGRLRVSCHDSEGDSYEFSQPFTMDMKYGLVQRKGDVGTRLSVHFEGAEIDHKRTVVAKPPVSARN